jgi:hypothetical protein
MHNGKQDGGYYTVVILLPGQPSNSSESYQTSKLFIPNHGTKQVDFAARTLNVSENDIVCCIPELGFPAVRAAIVRDNQQRSFA